MISGPIGPEGPPPGSFAAEETQKPATLKDLEIKPGEPKNGEKVLAPGSFRTEEFKKEEILIIENAAKLRFPQAKEIMKGMVTGQGVSKDQALVMAEALDQYVEKSYFKAVKHALKHARAEGRILTGTEKEQLVEKTGEKIRQKFLDTIHYFTSIDPRKGPETPLERMSLPFEYLSAPIDSSEKDLFMAAMSDYSRELIRLAFDQHLDNPEQYVSHGFDHSINVANYTRDVLRLNPEIVTATSTKYGINDGESKFLLETVALLHDCGYPCVGHRAKSVHGISGADLVLALAPMFEKIITSPGAKKELLFNDFRNSILFHSADKIEESFTTKIISTLGTFLADHDNVVQILSNFYDPKNNPSGQPRFVTQIYTQSADMKRLIEENLALARQDLERKLGQPTELPKVTVHGTLFKGRFADLEYNKDKLLGLEFTMTDLLTSPLTMIRLVDNMDMSKTRLSPTQNEEAFRMIYYKLGDNQAISKLAMALEKLEKEIDLMAKKLKASEVIQSREEVKSVTQRKMSEQMDLLLRSAAEKDPFTEKLLSKLTQQKIEQVNNPAEARSLLTSSLIEAVLEEERFSELSSEVKEKIVAIGMHQSSIDLRHFGGCEAVKSVQLIGIPFEQEKTLPSVVVTVDRALFEDLNTIKVTESSPTLTGVTQTVSVGVGEYQIWRASDAYRSIFLGNASIHLKIQDIDGKDVPSSVVVI